MGPGFRGLSQRNPFPFPTGLRLIFSGFRVREAWSHSGKRAI